MSQLPSFDEIKAAARRISGIAMRTPLIHSPPLSDLTGQTVYLKPECLQPGGAFKYRGATNAVSLLKDTPGSSGVITASSGNHGVALALAAERAGIEATIVVPENAPAVKIDRMLMSGATVIRHGNSYDECETRVSEILGSNNVAGVDAADRGIGEADGSGGGGYTFIHPFENRNVIAGQGTVGLEIHEDAPPDLCTVLVPVGGGGLISGVTLGLRYTRPDVIVLGVEPENGASLTAALGAGRPVPIRPGPSCAEGLIVRKTGKMSFEACEGGSLPVLVSEEEILDGVRYCLDVLKLVVEPSGAAAVAALISKKYRPEGAIALVVSGSNLGRKWLKAALEI